MDSKIYRLDVIDDDIIDLYIDCFGKDKIYIERDREIIKNKVLIKKMFNYYVEYGIILAMNYFGKPFAFLSALDVDRVKENKQAYELFFNKEKYPEVNKFITKHKECKYIVLIAVDKKHRNRLNATKLVNYYIKYYRENKMIFADVDNVYSQRIFKKMGFKLSKLKKDYYLALNNFKVES